MSKYSLLDLTMLVWLQQFKSNYKAFAFWSGSTFAVIFLSVNQLSLPFPVSIRVSWSRRVTNLGNVQNKAGAMHKGPK